SPQDIYHIMAGKTLKLLKLTVAMLSLVSKQRFFRVWKSFKYPHQWSKLSNPISYVESFMMSDCIQLGMIMPFILNRSLDANSFKPTELSIVAKCTHLVFKFPLSISDYKELEKILKEEREVLTINVEFELLKHYTTLQSIRHLIDDGLDPQYSRSNNDFVNMLQDSKHLFRNWFITEN
ncbi:19574_t:CDS:2, partial [Cetraspora pellucida]